MKSPTAIIAAPLLCLGVLAGIAVEKTTHVKAQDVAPYHARVKAAVEAMDPDYRIGPWLGKEVALPAAAARLLQPNVILSRSYVDSLTDGTVGPRGRGGRASYGRAVGLLLVHCRDSRFMVGHYPENCYPSIGEVLSDRRARDWQVGDVTVRGTEYLFTTTDRGRPVYRCVYNFLVVPDPAKSGGDSIVRDMTELAAAAEDYQRRHFGAAQFQVVFGLAHDLPDRGERDEIFGTLMAENLGVLKTLTSIEAP